VAQLSGRWFEDLKPNRRPLGEHLVHACRHRGFRPALSDTTGRALSGIQVLAGTLLLRGRLREKLATTESAVGLLLPPSAGGVLANTAVTLDGRIPVNLNFTVSADSLRSAIRQAGVRHLLTSRAFTERVTLPALDVELLFLEDLLTGMSRGRRLRAFLSALWAPTRSLVSSSGFHADAPAAILFSSGSSGEPKGIQLSHHNLLSNIEALRMVFDSAPGDRLCAALPFFHSLGFTATLWYPLLTGLATTYHTHPLDAAGVVRVIRKDRCTMLFATPGFLRLYQRKAQPKDFQTLRYVIVGAERLSPEFASSFESRFGVRPLEGYGATELSPVVSLSLPDVPTADEPQKGWKPGRVGLPLPGVAVKIVDPETEDPLPDGTAGHLLVKGPNVMTGYLNRSDLTAEAIQDGWYRTGDRARIDEDGFIELTDRLSRYSKIAGEMVPHGAVEETIEKALDRDEPVVAVTSVPDENRGERLVVFHTPDAGPVETLLRIVTESPLPNLWKPGSGDYIAIEKLPRTGTGKLDLAYLRTMAASPRKGSTVHTDAQK